MTVGDDEAAEIRRLYYAEHWKRGTIAAQLAVHPDVVKRVIGPLGPAPGTPRPPATLLDAYRGFIDATLEQYPTLVATRLFDMLVARGYTGSLRTLRRYVRKVRPRKRKVYLDLETLPGEVGQVDWAHVGEIAVAGGHRPLWLFVMVLAYSRAIFAELVLSLDASSLRRSLLRSAQYFDGNPRAWLFDNAKTVVIERRGALVRYHHDLVDLASALHVELRVCDPHAPHQKGAVERAIRYLKGRFFSARVIRDIEQGNRDLMAFIEDVGRARPHPRLPQQTVGDALEEEKPRLLELPSAIPPLETLTPAKVDSQAFVHLDTNRYSVPTTYAPGTLTMATTDTTVRLLDGQHEVASHRRCWGRKQVLEQREHREELLAERRAARSVKGRDRLRAEVPDIDVLLERWLERDFNLGSMVARTLRLLDLYGPRVLRAATADMIDGDLVDIGALAVRCDKYRHDEGGPPPAVAFELAPHVNERDVVPHDLGGYDE